MTAEERLVGEAELEDKVTHHTLSSSSHYTPYHNIPFYNAQYTTS